MDFLTNPEIWIALLTLTALEIVLGIDNIVFISIICAKLPVAEQARARTIGLLMAVAGRVALLLSLNWMIKLTAPLFTLPLVGRPISGRDLILLLGGLFLIAKSTYEIHHKLEGSNGEGDAAGTGRTVSFANVLFQIFLLDLVFSLDSVITAVGMADEVGVMITAVVIAIAVMIVFAGAVARFVDSHPTVKMLALSFLLLVGFTLVAEGFHVEIPKGYIYVAMAFSLFVEMLNLRMKKNRPVRLRGPHATDLDKPAPDRA